MDRKAMDHASEAAFKDFGEQLRKHARGSHRVNIVDWDRLAVRTLVHRCKHETSMFEGRLWLAIGQRAAMRLSVPDDATEAGAIFEAVPCATTQDGENAEALILHFERPEGATA